MPASVNPGSERSNHLKEGGSLRLDISGTHLFFPPKGSLGARPA